MQSPTVANEVTQAFTPFSDLFKVRIMYALSKRPMSVQQLIEHLSADESNDVEQSRVSHALIALSHQGIVSYKQKRREHIYSIDREKIKQIMAFGVSFVGEDQTDTCQC